jgi:site-specific DNA-methyltransferase (adenine-specific)
MTITNEDNMQLMARYDDNHFDLAIVDPPYGIDYVGISNTTKIKNKNKFKDYKHNKSKSNWDNDRPPNEYFIELQRVSKNQIIWGGNYFADLLAPKKGWIYWDKKITNSNNKDFSDGELAYTSFDCILRKFTYDWIGFGYLNNPQKQKKIHPTEKPISLYEWILMNYAKEGDKILDTHLGSGSIAIACHNLGYDLTACELDKEYYDAAIKRINQHKAQLRII